MSTVATKKQFNTWTHKLWVNLAAALISLLAAYGLASWAINTGSLLLYFLTFFCLSWAVNRTILGFRYKAGG